MTELSEDVIKRELSRVKVGWIGSLAYTLLLCGILSYAIYKGFVESIFYSPLLVDIVIFSIFTVGVYKRSRWLSIGLLLIFSIFYVVIPSFTKGKLELGIFSPILIYIFFRAAQASFNLHKLGYHPNKSLQPNADTSAE